MDRLIPKIKITAIERLYRSHCPGKQNKRIPTLNVCKDLSRGIVNRTLLRKVTFNKKGASGLKFSYLLRAGAICTNNLVSAG